MISVLDGDTIKVLDSSKKELKIRLAEIDTPEKKQAFGQRAKKALSQKIFGKSVKVKVATKDRYGRLIGTIMIGDRNINHEMVKEGYAWHYKAYSKSSLLARLEKEARSSRNGLWALPNPVAPWIWRRGKK